MQASSPLSRSRRGVLLCLIAPILICYLILTSSFTSDDVPIIAVGSQAAVLTLQNNNNNHGTTNEDRVDDADAVASHHRHSSLRHHDPDQLKRQRTMRRTSSASSSGVAQEAQQTQEQETPIHIAAEREDPVPKQRSENVAGSPLLFSSSSPFFSRLDRSWNRTCLRTIQRAISQWQRCVDPKVPSSSLHLKWKSPPNHCRFEVRPVKEAQAISLMWMWAMEAHGDSTLREIMKLFVGYFEIGGSLEKKDANQTLRDAKFFVKPFQSFPVSHLIVNPSKHDHQRQYGGGQVSDAFTVVHNSHMEQAARLVAARLDKQQVQQHRFALSELPAAYRVMFRFDFVPASLAEPMAPFLPRDLVLLKPPASVRNFPVESRFSFFDRTPRRLLLLSLGSHTAKLHVAEPAVRDRFGKQLLKQNAHSRNLLFHLFIADLEDYLILRVLGLHVKRPLSSERLHEAIDTLVKPIPSEIAVRAAGDESASSPLPGDESTAPVDLVLLLQQMLECHSMQDSVKHAFQRMSVFCEPMHQVVRNINHEIDVYFGLSAEDRLEEWHPNSALRLLSVEQRAVLHSRVMVVPPIDCHGGRTFQYALHKPYCTRDGIHLRNKFLGIQLDMILNVLSQAEECL